MATGGLYLKVELRSLTTRTGTNPVTEDTMAFLSLIQKSDDGDFLKTVAEAARQRIMDYDVENLIGGAPHERSPGRQT